MTSLFLIDGDSVIFGKMPRTGVEPTTLRFICSDAEPFSHKRLVPSHAVILLFQILQPPLLVLHVCKCCLLHLGKHLSRTQ